jgi:uncharacterized membrane protein
MTARALSDDRAKSRITEAVIAAEKLTSAEVVVAVRRHASPYFRTSLGLGTLGASATLAYLWFSPTVYDVRYMPLEILAVFGLVVFVAQSVDLLRFRLTPARVIASALDQAAADAFATIGVERTKGRSGVLVYAGLFEHEVRIVPDVGIDWGALGEAGQLIESRLNRAVASRDLDAFTSALADLGSVLAGQHPSSPEDENELCDAPH